MAAEFVRELRRPRQALNPSTVRKGSPVRVRQRAPENPLETAGFFVVAVTRPGGDSLRGTHLGRIREVSAITEGVATPT